MSRPVTFLHAELSGGETTSLRMVRSKIAALGGAADKGDLIVDLRGDRLLPGLINAHDHLHLNTLPPLATSGHWRHAREWVAQVNLRRRSDPAFEACISVALDERLLIGGIKNLLSGVTTVAHHDRLYPTLMREGFPTSLVTGYGWSHSLYVDGPDQVRDASRRTPPQWPWMIHLAEGTDTEAAGEFSRLAALGGLRANTLVVHGISLDRVSRQRLRETGAGLIWCPSSNLRLFGRTAEVGELARCGRVALGTDSRFTGSRDLLCELKAARASSALGADTLESLVTRDAAALLRLSDRGVLRIGARADLLVLPAGSTLPDVSRADIRLVVLGGRALYADADYASLLAPPADWAAVRIDGKPKMLARRLVSALSAAAVAEPGLDFAGTKWAAA